MCTASLREVTVMKTLLKSSAITAFKDSLSVKITVDFCFIYITIQPSPPPSWAVNLLSQSHFLFLYNWGPGGYQCSPVRSRWNSPTFPCNDSSELVLSSSPAECRWNCLFLLSVFSESGWRLAQGTVLWPFFGKTPQPWPLLRLSCCWWDLLWFWGCKTVLSTYLVLCRVFNAPCATIYTLFSHVIDLSHAPLPSLIMHWRLIKFLNARQRSYIIQHAELMRFLSWLFILCFMRYTDEA